MADIGFYHLTRSRADSALPALLGRTLAQGERALVVCADAAQVAALDASLWLAPAPAWLPHGTAATPHPQWQPVYLTDTPENPAGAKFLFMLDGAVADPAGFARVFDLFDGSDEKAVAAARSRWTEAKNAGHALTYWRQTETGWKKD